jgi:hypothetical protein
MNSSSSSSSGIHQMMVNYAQNETSEATGFDAAIRILLIIAIFILTSLTTLQLRIHCRRHQITQLLPIPTCCAIRCSSTTRRGNGGNGNGPNRTMLSGTVLKAQMQIGTLIAICVLCVMIPDPTLTFGILHPVVYPFVVRNLSVLFIIVWTQWLHALLLTQYRDTGRSLPPRMRIIAIIIYTTLAICCLSLPLLVLITGYQLWIGILAVVSALIYLIILAVSCRTTHLLHRILTAMHQAQLARLALTSLPPPRQPQPPVTSSSTVAPSPLGQLIANNNTNNNSTNIDTNNNNNPNNNNTPSTPYQQLQIHPPTTPNHNQSSNITNGGVVLTIGTPHTHLPDSPATNTQWAVARQASSNNLNSNSPLIAKPPVARTRSNHQINNNNTTTTTTISTGGGSGGDLRDYQQMRYQQALKRSRGMTLALRRLWLTWLTGFIVLTCVAMFDISTLKNRFSNPYAPLPKIGRAFIIIAYILIVGSLSYAQWFSWVPWRHVRHQYKHDRPLQLQRQATRVLIPVPRGGARAVRRVTPQQDSNPNSHQQPSTTPRQLQHLHQQQASLVLTPEQQRQMSGLHSISVNRISRQ